MSSVTTTVAHNTTILGQTFTFDADVTMGGAVVKNEEYAAAKAGTLSTRTSDTAGTLTLGASHGITDGQIIDIYWGSGSTAGVAYKATVGTVAGTSVPFTGASGDVLPIATTAITTMVINSETFVVTSAAARGLLVGCDGAPCVARFVDGSSADVYTAVVKDGAKMFQWVAGQYGDNPISDDVETVRITHGDSTSAKSPLVVVPTS